MADNLSNMIANINRASAQSQLSTLVPNTRLNRSCLVLLHRLGYVRGFVVLNEKKIRTYIKFSETGSVLRSIKRVSKPGNRVYASIHF
jgi:small subunit ribosomal protein S8